MIGGSLRLFLALVLLAGSLWYLFSVALIAWAFRDGIGPDSVESHGLLALSRSWRGMRWPPLIGSIPLMTAFLLIAWWLRTDESQ